MVHYLHRRNCKDISKVNKMSNKKKCPLKFGKTRMALVPDEYCDEKNCAFWDRTRQVCAYVSFARSMNNMTEEKNR